MLKIIPVKEEKLVKWVWQVGPAAVYWEPSWTQVWNDSLQSWFFHSFVYLFIYSLAVQNSSIGLIVRPLVPLSVTTNNQSLHNITE